MQADAHVEAITTSFCAFIFTNLVITHHLRKRRPEVTQVALFEVIKHRNHAVLRESRRPRPRRYQIQTLPVAIHTNPAHIRREVRSKRESEVAGTGPEVDDCDGVGLVRYRS